MSYSEVVFAKMRKARLCVQNIWLKNRDCSIFSDNCLAGMIYHDYGMRFNSPTINCTIHAYDYNRFLKYVIDRENICNIEEVPTAEGEAPKGILNGDVRIEFTHYSSFEEGLSKWQERAKRINYGNMLLLMTEKSVKRELVEEFDCLNYRHKIALVHLPYSQCISANYIKGFENQDKVGYIFGKYKWWGMTYYDQLNWVNILNNIKQTIE